MRGKSFGELAERIRDLQTLREKVLANTFAALEQAAPALVLLLLKSFGTRARAAEWMATPQVAFGGRHAYQVLADGEAELIWDCLLGIRPRGSGPMPIRPAIDRTSEALRS